MPRRPQSFAHRQNFKDRILLVYYSVLYLCFNRAAKQRDTHHCRAWYWTHKWYLFDVFHPASHGGVRKATFTEKELPAVHRALLLILHLLPTVNETGLCNILSFIFQRLVTRPVLGRILTKLRWSWRVPTRVQLNKFTPENLTRYARYVEGIQAMDWANLVFLDEAHVVFWQLLLPAVR